MATYNGNAGRVAIKPMGSYSASVQYQRLDLVKYGNKVFVCKKDCIGKAPVDGEYWMETITTGSDIGIATEENAGLVKPDGSTIEISDDGTISISEVIQALIPYMNQFKDMYPSIMSGVNTSDDAVLKSVISYYISNMQTSRFQYLPINSSSGPDGSLLLYRANVDEDCVSVFYGIDGNIRIFSRINSVWTVRKIDDVVPVTRGGTGRTAMASTDYTSANFRGESFHSTDTAPTSNGCIAWTYE